MIQPTIDEEIHIQSSNVDLGDALVTHCNNHIRETSAKYFGKVTSANAHFRHEGQAFAVSVRIKAGGLNDYAAEHTHRDAYQAFNSALAKVAKQLRRTKRLMREDPHRPERDPRMIGRELNPQQPIGELLRPLTEDARTHVHEAEIYEQQMQERHAAK